MVDIQWLIGGEAGYGIMTTGLMMSKIFTRLGMSVFDYVEYPSLIRGGHNAYYVRASDTQIYSQKKTVDILVALNRNTIDKHLHELAPGAVILFDSTLVVIKPEELPQGVILAPVPFLEITKQVGADRLMINTVSVGASLALFHAEFSVLEKIMHDSFGRKGEKVIAENINTSKGGFDHVKENYGGKFTQQTVQSEQKSMLIGGAEAMALGAIRAGLKFAAIYPMTPINGIMTTLIAHALKYSMVIKEPEDEIAGINMTIGASFAGVRAMTATSGGGFSLMAEALGLAAQMEVPLVVVEGMRPGPATGMPTWTDQADLRFVMHAAQGDFPRIVIAPGDIKESFGYIMQALNIAEKYQMLVIVLVDKYLMEGHATVNIEEFNALNAKFKLERGKRIPDEQLAHETDYKRYLLTEDGISPRSLPGQKGGIALTGSDEHDERGLYNETAEVRVKMMDKRFRKLDLAVMETKPFTLYGPSDAPLTLIGFGSTKMPALEAMEWLKRENIIVNFLKIDTLLPFPTEVIAPMIRNAEKTMVLELNHSGQLEGVIKQYTCLTLEHHFRKYDGRPFYPEEIVQEVKKALGKV
ncbi:2-oxoacid:acceptor oxidoreductase subunit alpha [soil metagenome]